jgi:rubrerythrin
MSPPRGDAAARAARAAPDRAKPVCPKCGAPRADEACPRCGLVYARWHGSRRAVTTDVLDTERLWREVAADFLAPERHAVFIAHCLHSGELPFAVARYADEARGTDPERARVARERRRQVATMAEVMLFDPVRTARRHEGLWRRLRRLINGE